MILRRRHQEDIGFQIAPMIDITWILIIFFMVTMHLAETEFSVEVDLPIASAAEVPPDMDGRVVVNINQAGNYFVGNAAMTLPELTAHLRIRLLEHPPLKVYLRADADIPAQKTKEFYRACAESGAVEIILASFRDSRN
ncbi:MAG: biopolymer transport protein ExbD [Verrucomicrobia bacterium]|jgi:biopolymer transport protein ExbD|nr:MAG: biopolymer transport protein ExbD [Verrucomicrobiota bacterium]